MGAIMDHQSFIRWLAVRLRSVAVNLCIKRSPKNSHAIESKLSGIYSVLQKYSWKASWTDFLSVQVNSEDWASTKSSIRRLSDCLRSTCAAKHTSDRELLEVCREIMTWGGDRDSRKGAGPFLEKLARQEKLKTYLLQSRNALRLALSDGPARGQIQMMNSMLSKIHALLADDGLPIYDSRVAATAACFVEMYRRETHVRLDIPESLIFPPVGGGGARRTVNRLYPDCMGAKTLTYNKEKIVETAHQWSRAKWHLGRVFRDVLAEDPSLFADEGDAPARAHALEASFFMIGYDVQCLAR